MSRISPLKLGITCSTLAALLAVPAVGASSPGAGVGEKHGRSEAPTLSRKLHDRVVAREKAPAATKASSVARADRIVPLAPSVRAKQFSERRAGAPSNEKQAGASLLLQRPLPEAASAGKVSALDGRGVGAGDIYEVEPNDSQSQAIVDLPVNVVGHVSASNDVDFFSVPVTSGDSIRVEVVADRVFGSPIDSTIVVLRDDGHTSIASNDDYFSNSNDSFVRFTAPYTGRVLVGVGDARASGGSDYGYVLNMAVASDDFSEVEPNDDAQRADDFILPAVAFGGADFFGDLDVYAFEGIAGETLTVDVDAEIFLSQMDSLVELYDRTGAGLFINDDTDGLDSRFNIVLPYTGLYFISVEDRDGRSGDGYYYSLNLSTQSGIGAPTVTTAKFSGGLLRAAIGRGFDPSGARAELNGDRLASSPAPRKPTTQVRIRPAVEALVDDVVTVVNPDGRRSNPGVIQ